MENQNKYNNVFKKIILDDTKITCKLNQMAQKINHHYRDLITFKKPLICIGILNGCFPFFSDLLARLNIPIVITFLKAKSYCGSDHASEQVELSTSSLDVDLKDHHILIIDDIYDSGRSMNVVYNYVKTKKPISINCAVFLNKVCEKAFLPKHMFFGAQIENQFLIGYGLDYRGQYRYYRQIGVANIDALAELLNKDD